MRGDPNPHTGNKAFSCWAPTYFPFPVVKMSKQVYAIETENRRWYVGASKDPAKRIRAHFNGKGAEFLKQNEPRRVVYVTEERKDWKEVEKALTLWFMERFGKDRVRGYAWTSTKPGPLVREVTGYPKHPNNSTVDSLNVSKIPPDLPLYLYL